MALRYRPLLILPLAALALLAVVTGAGASPHASAAQTPQYQVPLPTPTPPDAPSYLTPTPIVRLAGSFSRSGARIKTLVVTSPRGSKVTARCSGGRGKGCPYKKKTVTSPKSRRVRFKALERRLKRGALIRIFVMRGNTIGKYTSFRIRSNRAPAREDACLFPGDPSEPRGCP